MPFADRTDKGMGRLACSLPDAIFRARVAAGTDLGLTWIKQHAATKPYESRPGGCFGRREANRSTDLRAPSTAEPDPLQIADAVPVFPSTRQAKKESRSS